MKIVIVGASGFLGTKLSNILSKYHQVIKANINPSSSDVFSLDATNKSDVEKFISEKKPNLVIDTVALTSSFLCEKNPEEAEKLNYITAKNICESCLKNNAVFVFISSSYVFDGKKGNYSESDTTSPESVYGKTKLKAEKFILKFPDTIVLRVDLLYGYNSKNSPNGIFGKVLSGEKIELGNHNQIRQPLLVDNLPEIILSLVNKNRSGLFHIAGKSKIKTIDFIKELENLIREDSKIAILDEKNLSVKPMKDTSLNISKIESLGIKTSSIKDGLNYLKKLLNH